MRAIPYRTTPTVPRPMLLVVYLVIGAFVAATHHYFAHLHMARQYGSAALAILLWPLLFLGVNLHIH
jgi:Zn-dependent protease